MKLKPIAQEHPYGCGIACIAFIINKTYKTTLKLFENSENAKSKGFYCRDIVKALEKNGLNYKYCYASPSKLKLIRNNAVVFIRRSKKYPTGHYLVKTKKGFMNSWINFPDNNIKSGFSKKLPGKAQWIIYSK